MTDPGIWHPRYAGVTVGAVALIVLAALESLAVTTVMPVVSADLDGAALYAVAFSGTLATSVIGMVATGAWCDRAGPLAPLTTCVSLFLAGLVLAGFATTMPVLVLGRLLQGLGTGGQIVALYVVVARVYPARLHGRVFSAFAAAWVVPSLVGPFLAGAVTQLLHWRWVFLGVAVLTAVAFTVVVLKLRRLPLRADRPASDPVARRLVCAVSVAVGGMALGLAGETGRWFAAVVAASVVIVLVAVRPLLPLGTLRARAGLPSVVLMRGLIAGALFGAEIYIPYLLIEDGFSPIWAGLALTSAALTWAAGSEVSGRIGDRLGNARIAALGVAQLGLATSAAAVVALGHLPAVLLIVAWAFAGAGMGLMYPRLTVLTLAYSTPQNQGFHSSALSIFDALGGTVAIAVMGLVFSAIGGTDAAFAAVFTLAAVLALAALVPGLRLGHAREERPIGV